MVATSLVETASSVHPPAVSATIGDIKGGTSEVEVVAVRIARIDAEVPVACVKEQGTVEIGGCAVEIPLPRVENIAQVEVAALPVGAKHIVLAGNTHEVVEVYLVGSLILSVSEVELISHLIGEEEGFVASLLVRHGAC